MPFLRFPQFISILWSAISTHQSYSLIYHALFFLINLPHHLKSTSSTNFFFGYQCYASALIFWLPTTRILPGSFLFCPIAPLLMSKFSELLPMYFLILTFFLNGLHFFCPLGQNLPPFRTHHSGIRDPNDKNETENALACQPGLPLPCSFLGVCGLSAEVVFPLGAVSESSGSRTACQCPATTGFRSWWVAPEEGRARTLTSILTTQLALSPSPPQADSPTAMALPPAESEAGFGPKSETSPMCHRS